MTEKDLVTSIIIWAIGQGLSAMSILYWMGLLGSRMK